MKNITLLVILFLIPLKALACEPVAKALKVVSESNKNLSKLYRGKNKKQLKSMENLCVGDRLIIGPQESVTIQYFEIEDPLLVTGFNRYTISKQFNLLDYVLDLVSANVNDNYAQFNSKQLSTRGNDTKSAMLLNRIPISNSKIFNVLSFEEDIYFELSNVNFPVTLNITKSNGKVISKTINNSKLKLDPNEFHPLEKIKLNLKDSIGEESTIILNLYPTKNLDILELNKKICDVRKLKNEWLLQAKLSGCEV